MRLQIKQRREMTESNVRNSVSLWLEARWGQIEREQPVSPEMSREIMHGN